MASAAHDFKEFRFSSASLPERDRLAFCREEFGRKMSRYEMESFAFEAGFGDLSYFNPSFRRRFGMTPSDVRVNRT